jgi:hypothetical protein
MALFGGIALFNILACLPILLSSPVRRLFSRLPADNLAINYLLGVGGFTVFHAVSLIVVITLSDGLEGVAVFWGLGGVTLGTGLLSWSIVSFLFPRLDWWDPREIDGELDGRLALGLGLAWYIFSGGIALFLLLLVSIALFFPG